MYLLLLDDDNDDDEMGKHHIVTIMTMITIVKGVMVVNIVATAAQCVSRRKRWPVCCLPVGEFCH
jgi:hypothetical protein